MLRICWQLLWGFGVLGTNLVAHAENFATNTVNGSTNSVVGAWYVGSNGAFNVTIVTNRGLFKVAGNTIIGNTVTSSNNLALVTGPGSVWSNAGNFYIGYYSSSNNLTIANGLALGGSGGNRGGAGTRLVTGG